MQSPTSDAITLITPLYWDIVAGFFFLYKEIIGELWLLQMSRYETLILALVLSLKAYYYSFYWLLMSLEM